MNKIVFPKINLNFITFHFLLSKNAQNNQNNKD